MEKDEVIDLDTISRQAAIEVADAVWVVTGDKNVAKVWDQIKDLPSAQPEIIRCKDCKHRIEHKHYGDLGESAYTCEGNMGGWILPDNYCSYAERRADG